MPIDGNTRLDTLAEGHPYARRLLSRLGLDIRAEGDLTLQTASERHGFSLHELLRGLEAAAQDAPGTRDWLTAPPKQLIAHIVLHHHGYAREELARLGPLMSQALDENGGLHPELAEVAIHLRELDSDLKAHFLMEERNLFPAILAMATGAPIPITLSTPSEQLSTIHAEHQAVEELFLNLRLLTGDYRLPEQASPALRALYLGLRDLEDDLHVHLYLENHLLFPRVLDGGLC